MSEKTTLVFSQPSCEFYQSTRHKTPLRYGDPFDTDTPDRFLERDLAMKPKRFVERHLARAKRAARQGRPDRARAELGRVLAVDPKNKHAVAVEKSLVADEEE